MASNIVREHEEEFCRVSAEITVLCGKLKHSPTLVSMVNGMNMNNFFSTLYLILFYKKFRFILMIQATTTIGFVLCNEFNLGE